MKGYPDIDKVLYEKDRGTHAIMGFKAIKLYEPPYLQVALDLDNEEAMARIIKQLPNRERILLEAGTPLVKKFGVGIVGKISGALAQLGAHNTGSVGVRGSSPLCSIDKKEGPAKREDPLL